MKTQLSLSPIILIVTLLSTTGFSANHADKMWGLKNSGQPVSTYINPLQAYKLQAVAGEDHVRVLVSALVLGTLSHVLGNIPEVGEYLAKIFGAAGTFAAGAALTIISRNIWNRYKP